MKLFWFASSFVVIFHFTKTTFSEIVHFTGIYLFSTLIFFMRNNFCGLFSRMNFKKKSQYKNVILFQMRWNRGTVHRDMWHWFFHSIGIWKIILHRIETKLLVQTYLWREISAHANLQSFSSSICHHQINNSAAIPSAWQDTTTSGWFWF